MKTIRIALLCVFALSLLSTLFVDSAPKYSQPTKFNNYQWIKAAGGNVMLLSGDIENTSIQTVRDVQITCEHFGNSGSKIDSNVRTVHESVPAKGTISIKDFNMGLIHSQATRTTCKVTKVS